EVRELKDSTSADIVVGGAALAATAFKAGLVDEIFTTLYPVIIGSGKPAFPTDQRLDLDLIDNRRFENGAVHMHYRVK
ncbi:MAG: dihydrofolate reductase family protein, partial [Solirubrobacterales bacterium]